MNRKGAKVAKNCKKICFFTCRRFLAGEKTKYSLAYLASAQMLTYLKMAELKLGFLLNWQVRLMKDGIKRMVCGYKEGD